MAAEKAGIPAVEVACEGFVQTAKLTCEGEGLFGARIVAHPGHAGVDTDAELLRKSRDIVLPEVIKGWTTTPKISAGAGSSELNPKDIVFKGTFEQVNGFFLEKLWSDGLPVVPPTLEKVQEFLQFTDLSPDTNLGLMLPANRHATVWSVAVNGVMAGCRPEYMPVLLAIVEAIADPKCNSLNYGSTSGYEQYIIVSGPIAEQLGFHSGVAFMRPGTQANTSVGRFLRLYLRNISGFVPGTSDKAWAGRNWQPAIAEDMTHSPWEPFHVTLGYKPGTNTVTVVGVQAMTYHHEMSYSTPEEMVEGIAYKLAADHIFEMSIVLDPETHPLLVMSPMIARVLAQKYTKKQVSELLFQKARIPASDFDKFMGGNACNFVKSGRLPRVFCENENPNRLVPMWHSGDELYIIVAGDNTRNRLFATNPSGTSHLITKEIKLPKNWARMLPRENKISEWRAPDPLHSCSTALDTVWLKGPDRLCLRGITEITPFQLTTCLFKRKVVAI